MNISIEKWQGWTMVSGSRPREDRAVSWRGVSNKQGVYEMRGLKV